MTNLLERNILSLYGLKFSRWFLLPMPIIVPFFQDLGLSIQEIMWLQSIYSITVVAVEIPSGYASDAIGRKQTLLIGSILTTLGFILYAIAGNFFSLLAAAMTIAIGSSFVSYAVFCLI